MSRLRSSSSRGKARSSPPRRRESTAARSTTFRDRIAELAPWVDAMNATDNTAAHAHASNVAVAIALAQAGVETDPAGRVP